jgi:hypothetical protein
MNEGHPDAPLLEHSKELISKLDALGITPSPPEGEDDVNDEWECSDSDGDIEMV